VQFVSNKKWEKKQLKKKKAIDEAKKRRDLENQIKEEFEKKKAIDEAKRS